MGDLVTRHGAKMTIACFAVFILNIILYLSIGEFKLATIQSPGAMRYVGTRGSKCSGSHHSPLALFFYVCIC